MKFNKIQFPKAIGSMLVTGLMVMSMSAFAQEKTATVKGEVLDMSCYMSSGAKGAGHKQCAQMCLNKGLPAGLLTSSGEIYLLVEDHDKADAYKKAIKHAADNVKVTGKVADKNGMKALIVENVETGS